MDFLLDGGHNEHALEAVHEALTREISGSGCGGAQCEVCTRVPLAEMHELPLEPRGQLRARRRRLVLVYGGTASRDLRGTLRALLQGAPSTGSASSSLLRPTPCDDTAGSGEGDLLLAAPFPAPPGMPWIQCHAPAAVAAAAAELCPGLQVRVCATVAEALAAAAAVEGGGGVSGGGGDTAVLRVVCGSLYLVGEVHRVCAAAAAAAAAAEAAAAQTWQSP